MNLTIPDRGRLIANVVPLGERPRDEVDPYGVIGAWRTEPDPNDVAFQSHGLCLVGESLEGRHTRMVFVPEGVIAQGLRERIAAVYVGTLLLFGRTK